MRAAVYAAGAPQNVVVTSRPVPGFKPERRHANHVLCRVVAAGVNPVDAKSVVADKLPESCVGLARRAVSGRTVGFDFSGEVVSAGTHATNLFRPGDAVFGCMPPLQGTFCEYVVAPVSQVTRKPTGLSHAEAAALPIPIVTCIQAMRGHKAVRGSVLVIGASGGVGSIAVQVAKAYGNSVTAVCSERNAKLVTSLGANHVIAYDTCDTVAAIRSLAPFDLVLDTVTSHESRDTKDAYMEQLTAPPSVLRDPSNHAYVTIGGPTSYWVRTLTKRWFGLNLFAASHDHHWIRFPGCASDLSEAARLIAEAGVRPVLAESVPLTDAGVRSAFAAMHGRRAVGKWVVEVARPMGG